MFELIFRGDFKPEQVHCSWVKSSFRLSRALRGKINRQWNAELRRRGKSLFDGPMCRLESWRVEDAQLYLKFSRTSYKWFWGTHLKQTGLKHGVLANSIGLSAALVSADGYLIFGKRGERVAYHPNRIHPFAGSAVDIDVFSEMRRELLEEIGISADDIADIRCIGMAKDKKLGQPELVFYVACKRARAEMARKVDRAEHRGIYSVRNNLRGLGRAERNKELTPIARAAVGLRAVFETAKESPANCRKRMGVGNS